MFLWNLYQSSAELMPHDCRAPSHVEAPPLNDDRDHETRHVNQFLKSLQIYSSDVDVHMIGPGTFCGQCRYLQCSSRTELFWEYVAACTAKSEQHASYSTFLRVANTILKPGLRNGHLKFRSINQHGQCDQCFELKSQLRKARTPAAQEDAQRALAHHHLSQWSDRQHYWSYRTMSHNWCRAAIEVGERMMLGSVAVNCVCVIADGMDQSKFRIPRTRDRSSKLYQQLFRPQLHVSGCWSHGHQFEFATMDEDCKKDSECQCEIISRALSNLYNDIQDFPAGLVLQQDNCYREGKNQYVLSFMILMVALRVTRWSMCNYLRKGHRNFAGFSSCSV